MQEPPRTLTLHAECELKLQQTGRCLVLGLSGGRDSIALFHRLREEGYTLYARHLHHGIRGAEADRDADFCRQICELYQIDYAQKRVDIPQLAAERKQSVELVAREERRLYLQAEAQKLGCTCIALAQHADDQAETVLFRLGRGAAGPRGMRPLRPEGNFCYLRPLLNCRRSDITQYLQERDYAWCDDSTNEGIDYTRNALRNQVIPAYSQAMGRDIVPILLRSAQLQESTQSALGEALELLRGHFYDPQGRLYLPALQQQSRALRSALLHDYLKQAAIHDVQNSHIEAALSLIDAPEGGSINLSKGYQLRRAHKRLFISASLSKSKY